MTQRRVTLALLSIQLVSTLLIQIGQWMVDPTAPSNWVAALTLLVVTALLVAYWYGWEYARQVDVVAVTLIVAFVLPEPFVTSASALLVLVPPALALIFTPPIWIPASMLAVLAILLVRGNGVSAYTHDLRTLATIIVIVGSMYLGRLVADRALRSAERLARSAEEARRLAVQQAEEIAGKAAELEGRNQQQQQLLDLVATLETPTVALADGVLLAPLVGNLDARRTAALTERLLHTIKARRTRLLVLDIAGVAVVDQAVATALLDTARAVRLLGCRVTITGIAPAVALLLSQSDLNLSGVATARAPQEALAAFLAGGSVTR